MPIFLSNAIVPIKIEPVAYYRRKEFLSTFSPYYLNKLVWSIDAMSEILMFM